MQIQRHRPFGRIAAARTFILPVEQINPLIRIAHRNIGALRIEDRIIFDYEFVLVLSGRGFLTTPAGPVPLKPGTLIFIRPFWPHGFDFGGKQCDHMAVHFDFRPNLPPKSKDPGERSPYEVQLTGGLQIPPVHQCLPGDAIWNAFAALIDAAKSSAPISQVQQRAELMRMISMLVNVPRPEIADDAGADSRTAARIDRAIRHIAAELKEPLSADELAEIAGLSPSHFTRLFRAYTGYTPMQFLRHERIKAARILLADVDLSIKEIAARCGFDDQYHFSKVFHQIDGLSPSEYREAALAGRVSSKKA